MWSFYLICKRTTNIIRLADLRTDDAQSASPDSEQIEPAGAEPLRRNSVSVEQIQDREGLRSKRLSIVLNGGVELRAMLERDVS